MNELYNGIRLNTEYLSQIYTVYRVAQNTAKHFIFNLYSVYITGPGQANVTY